MRNCRLFLILISLFWISSLAFADCAKLISIEMKKDRGFDYLDIYTSGQAFGKGLLLENKLYIDFPDTVIAADFSLAKRPSKRINRIETVMKDATTTRLIIHLKKTIDYDLVNVFGRGKTVIEISDRLDNIFAYQAAWEKSSLSKKATPLKPRKFTAIRRGALLGKTIIIDPGHGGDDPGALAANGPPEKQLTLQTAQLVCQLLHEAGAEVYITRDEDRRSNLHDVVDFANKSRADIFISLHYNSTYNSGISGTETYYYNSHSRRFAEIMHEALVRGLQRKDRGLHRMPFYVIKNTDMPAVLLEPVYLTNCSEQDLAKSQKFQRRLAEAIVKGVEKYF